MSNLLDAGDVVYMSFDPQAGREQKGRRPALVVSSKEFNRQTGFAVVCPITSQVKDYPFEVAVSGTESISGVVLTHHFKSLDWRIRKAEVVDRVDPDCLDTVKGYLNAIIND